MYDIKLTYQTGDETELYETCNLIKIPMSKIETAEENLRRILSHHTLYEYKPLDYVYPDFYIRTSEKGLELNGIKLLLDDGSEHEIHYPFWIGDFEYLESAEIVLLD